MRFDEGLFADTRSPRCDGFLFDRISARQTVSCACILLPGHWIEPSRPGRTVQVSVPELADRVEESEERRLPTEADRIRATQVELWVILHAPRVPQIRAQQ